MADPRVAADFLERFEAAECSIPEPLRSKLLRFITESGVAPPRAAVAPHVDVVAPECSHLDAAILRVKRQMILAAINNVLNDKRPTRRAAAVQLGINVRRLQREIKRLNIRIVDPLQKTSLQQLLNLPD